MLECWNNETRRFGIKIIIYFHYVVEIPRRCIKIMKNRIREIIFNAVQTANEKGDLPSPDVPPIEVEEPKNPSHGDFSTNIAMVNASVQKMAPRKIAEIILGQISDPDKIIEKTEIAGPGFINFYLKSDAWYPVLQSVHQQDHTYGATNIGRGQKIQVEFVSANPTGPLHVGHGRGATVGDVVGNILSFCGYDIEKEYYINDAGRQISTLGRSVYLRFKELQGEEIEFPEDCYQGDYIYGLAEMLKGENSKQIAEYSESEAISFCANFAAKKILEGIREDLSDFGVDYDHWFSEQSLYDDGKVESAIEDGKDRKTIYENEGALWFNTTAFGDEKDRVVVKQNGDTTYFASDIAYHQNKYNRGFHRVIDVWGADHHGYIQRLTAAIEASGYHRDQFNVILVQFVNLLRGGEPVAMSTRAGEFVTLKDVVDEVGKDAARFIFLTRHYESPLDFDLEIAKQKTNDNPVYYVQYVHARISSIIRKAEERGVQTITKDEASIFRLDTPEDIQLMKALVRYPEVVAGSAEFMEPHRITFYLMNLASVFHAYYNKHRVLTDESELTIARLYLVQAVQKVIRNGLGLLGVSAPEKM